MINEEQIFECPTCGHRLKSISINDCDSLESSPCLSCHFGHYRWLKPVEDSTALYEALSIDNFGQAVDKLFEEIMGEDS